ncbi:hypothetical protein HII31_00711 [Pseudocercospora fuligena]|uniref:RGS domain-containing protein n=1 Tax=Pseudocercospora fuligena TaxID=685502 RepID=A0A8H6VPQ4_9PEZI|nr:hypothetical protein HII31_00711 [Pseudocercospora fuligena]
MIFIVAKRHHLEPHESHDYTHGQGLAILIYSIIYWLWTVAIGIGLAELYRKREEKAVRIRDWRLVSLGVIGIHSFITTVFAAAWKGPSFSCSARFWVVSLVLPLCVAAFQLPNAKLADYYNRNRANRDALVWRNTKTATTIYGRWKRASIAQRTYILIGLGAFVQVGGTALFYFGSRRFHHHYGLWGTEQNVDSDACFFGWEWVIAVIWQVIWAYGSGIIVLLQIRGVYDIYKWALETRFAVLASTIGLPLWLVFMFAKSDAITAIDTYAPPPAWFVPGFAVSQAVLLGFPLHGVYKNRKVAHRTSSVFSETHPDLSIKMMREVIRYNFDDFADYAARTKLNAEMVIFLRDVKQWKAAWMPNDRVRALHARENWVKCYKHAALLYFKLVDMDIAPFPVNLDGPTRLELKQAFSDARYVSPKHSVLEKTTAMPWEEQDPRLTTPPMTPAEMKEVKITLEDAEASIIITSSEASSSESDFKSLGTLDFLSVDENIAAPQMFSMDVFDAAYKEVERDCFQNTYTDYVKSGEYQKAIHAPTSNA